jgi:hydroxyacylglutathione hydrolase
LIVRTLPVGMLQVNCYVLGSETTREAVVIDPGDQASEILATARRDGLNVTRILGTHAHFDHVLACRQLQEATAAPFYLHEGDLPVLATMQRTCQAWLGYDPGEPPAVTGYLAPGDVVEVGEIRLEVRHTPGHSPGSVTLVDHAGRRAFTGDALFAGSIGRTDLPGGNLNTLLSSIREQILTLPDDYAVLSGHGEASNVGAERRTNPFLNGTAW